MGLPHRVEIFHTEVKRDNLVLTRGRVWMPIATSAAAGLVVGAGITLAYLLNGELTAGETDLDRALMREPPVLWSIDTRHKLVALTFDDGPDPDITYKILRVLRKYGVKATFFVEGRNVARYPRILRAELAGGHEVGNHTMNHRDLQSLTPTEAAREIDQAARAIQKVSGHRPMYLRPPRGHLSLQTLRIARRSGHRVVMWSAGLERLRRCSMQGIGARVADHVAPGAIILAHDSSSTRRWVPRALPWMIRAIRARGYRIVTLGELLAAGGR